MSCHVADDICSPRRAIRPRPIRYAVVAADVCAEGIEPAKHSGRTIVMSDAIWRHIRQENHGMGWSGAEFVGQLVCTTAAGRNLTFGRPEIQLPIALCIGV